MAQSSYYGTGRRKAAVAKVWLIPGEEGSFINGLEARDYLKREELKIAIDVPLKVAKLSEKFKVKAKVLGGGIAGQADAIQLGIARALVQYDESLRSLLRKNDLLTRDPREKERKKFGQKGARRSFQFTKR